ncbi:CHASE4 domain-containing protein [Anaerolinea sp.]|uniref:CHASE4 domain-containing protein n=1 Tax=Anaerolinea sp. TaxID=1872519 RepID=UPI002ACE2037|nr:CHASE4 domain-containing protein [Anaerolinea sp.]
MEKARASLKWQTVSLVVVTSVVIISGLILASLLLFQQSYLNLEQQAVRQQTRLVVSLIQKEQEKLERFVQDWGPWDDTYFFARNENPDYVEKNLAEATFANQKFNIFLVVDEEKRVVFYRQYHLERKTWVRSPFISFLQEILKHPYLAERSEVVAPLRGVLRTGDGFWLISGHPILHSDFSGPRAGTLVVARQVNDALRQEVMAQSSFQVEFEALPLGTHSMGFDVILPVEVHPIDAEWARGSVVFQDVYLRPAFRVSVRVERLIFKQGREVISFFCGYPDALWRGVWIGGLAGSTDAGNPSAGEAGGAFAVHPRD